MVVINSNSCQKAPIVAEAYIENFSHDGRGIARINGKTTFIQGALPSEHVSFRYLRRKRDFDEGLVESVLVASPSRSIPRCPHYDNCGGCAFQHFNEHEQIYAKQVFLLELLARYGHAVPALVLPPLTQENWHYRHKARFSVRHLAQKQETLVGFRERHNPRFIAKITQCPVMHNKIAIMPLRKLIGSFDNPQIIAQIEVAIGDEDVALILRNLAELSNNDQDKLRKFGKDYNFRIFLQPKGIKSIYLFYPEDNNEFLTYTLPQENIKFHFHPTDFIQVNIGLNALMVQQALQLMALTPKDLVLDLFCGLGNFSLPMAKYCARLVGIEGNLTMTNRAASNAKANGLTNVEFHCMDLTKIAIENMNNNHDLTGQMFSKVLLDPPRTGALEIVKQINKFTNLKRLVYVSCNPATLARDCNILVNTHGYNLATVGVMDLFPHTIHVEAIALFTKNCQ